jgi:two-component system, cell cycle sensor histidine kinase and response regulator CckA
MRPPSGLPYLFAISRLGHMLARGGALGGFLEETVRLAAACAAAPCSLLLQWLPSQGAFTVTAGHGWPEPVADRDLARPVPAHATDTLNSRAPGGLLRRDLARRNDEPALLSAHGLQAAAAVAIGNRSQPFGVLAVYSPESEAFSDETLQVLDALASLAGAAIDHEQQSAELDSERDRRFRVASLVDGTDDAIVSATLDGAILTWNPGAERLYGYVADEILGRDVSLLIPAEREADRRLLLSRVRSGERIPAFDAAHRRKDGSPVTVSLSLSPVKDRHGRVVAVAGIAHDVTESRRVESELRQIAKMDAVGRLAGGLAHDFNNMLTVIDGYSQLVLMKLPADSPVRGLVEEIHKAGDRAADLTRQLMVFSRKSMVEPQVLNLTDIVQSNAEMLRRVLGEDVSMVTSVEPALAHVMADRSQLEQVLVNLIINARDAMPGGGCLTISTANVRFDTAHGVAPREIPAGQYVELSVADTGLGMDAATRSRLFEPFFTTKGSGRGTGLGLAMLQHFVMQSGGFVAVDTEPGRGSCFRIYLPTVLLPVAPGTPAAAADSPSGSETVLVVEDDDAVRQFTEAVLLAAGYQVLSAAHGDDALTLARTHAGPVHLLITDVVMPVLDGHALASRFRRLHPEAHVLFTSGYTPEAVSRRGITIPAAQFIQKPYSPAALCRLVRAALDD